MSAIRYSVPGQPVVYHDLGPCRHVPLRGHATLRGAICKPRATKYEPDSTTTERVRRFRERHGGRKAVAA